MTDERKFRPDVEGLRAVAVGLVVLAHAGVPWLAGGYVGVDVFFVLSGFLITGLLVREKSTTGRISMVGFYARRARRILPAASVVLVVTVLASYEWLGFLRGDDVAEDGKWAAIFTANLRFASEGTQYLNILEPPSPLQHYWSLAVEEQFYLVWPLVFIAVAAIAPKVSLAAKLASVLALIIVASLAWSVVQTETNPTWAFFSPLTRAWELAIGALLAVGFTQVRRLPRTVGALLSWAGLLGIAASAILFDAATPFPGYAVALPVVATALAVAGGSVAPGRGAERVLRFQPFQWLGKVSYSLYLWHWPLLVIPAERAGQELSPVQTVGLVGAAVALAAVTHYALENPVRFARPLTRSPWSSVGIGASLVLVAFAICAWRLGDAGTSPSLARVPVAHADPLPPTEVAAAPRDPVADVEGLVAASQEIEALPEDLIPDLERARWDFAWLEKSRLKCLLNEDEVTPRPCELGDPGGTRTVVVLGDSHAAMWLAAFHSLGEANGWKVILHVKTGCPAASLGISRELKSATQRIVRPYPECARWLDEAISRINELSPMAVILASCNGCEFLVGADGKALTKEAWAAGLQTTLGRFTGSEVKKVVLGDIPRMKGGIDCLARHPANVGACTQPAEPIKQETFNDVEARVAAAAGAGYIDVTSWFCGSVCTPIVGNMVVYTNDYHVTDTYARHLAGALGAALTRILAGD